MQASTSSHLSFCVTRTISCVVADAQAERATRAHCYGEPRRSSMAFSIACSERASSGLGATCSSRVQASCPPSCRRIVIRQRTALLAAQLRQPSSGSSGRASTSKGRSAPGKGSPGKPQGKGTSAPSTAASGRRQLKTRQPSSAHKGPATGHGAEHGLADGVADGVPVPHDAPGAMLVPAAPAGGAPAAEPATEPTPQRSDDAAAAVDYEDVSGQGDEEAFPEMQLSLPPPNNVKVRTASYMQSCVTVSACPAPRLPEFAVIGRSNVGKSSLINMLTGRKDLAMVSKQPGKTKCINHFLINDSWFLVDLPGYGYARTGADMREAFEAFTKEYFTTRPNLAMVLLLVDSSVPPQRVDLDYANWLTDNGVPFALVFTKADKRRKGLTSATHVSHITAFKRALLRDLAYLPLSVLTSAEKSLGKGELLNLLASLRVAMEKSGVLQVIRQQERAKAAAKRHL